MANERISCYRFLGGGAVTEHMVCACVHDLHPCLFHLDLPPQNVLVICLESKLFR